MELNLNHLRYFISAAKAGGLGASAKAHNVSQSAISQAIRKLEEALGCELLIHNRNSFKLTKEGDYLVENSEGLFKQIDFLKDQIQSLNNEVAGKVLLSTSSTVAQFLLPSIVKDLKAPYPKLQLHVSVGDVAFIVSEVKSGRAELGIVIDDGHFAGLERKLLKEGSFACITSSEVKASIKKPEFLVTRESPGAEELRQVYKKKFHSEPAIAVEVESWEAIVSMAQMGLGVGFVPEFILDYHAKIKVVPQLEDLGKKIRYKMFVVHKGAHQLSRQAEAFLKVLVEK
ncbi:LysR family transcriptional regulator [Bdellovibrio bacteriovorus]|uniref:LysR family transcriptional regulator n=1 Tax=Bdellovibrio bacteriovorus TaxID=959 RepID=UPI0035A59244